MIAPLLGFALASTLLILAPGPDSLLVMRNTVRDGQRAGWVTACGILSGLLVWVLAAALGLSALLRVSHLGYDILRFAGAGYLIWLGLSSLGLRRRAHASPGASEPGEAAGRRPGRAGRRRLYLNGLWFIAETGAWLAALAWMADRGVSWLRRSTVQRWLERLTGIALIGFGLRLATQTR
jgi:threonine/homoserine/homoserine lactone efflux protein